MIVVLFQNLWFPLLEVVMSPQRKLSDMTSDHFLGKFLKLLVSTHLLFHTRLFVHSRIRVNKLILYNYIPHLNLQHLRISRVTC